MCYNDYILNNRKKYKTYTTYNEKCILSYKFMLNDVVLHFCFIVDDLKIIIVGISVGNKSFFPSYR